MHGPSSRRPYPQQQPETGYRTSKLHNDEEPVQIMTATTAACRLNNYPTTTNAPPAAGSSVVEQKQQLLVTSSHIQQSCNLYNDDPSAIRLLPNFQGDDIMTNADYFQGDDRMTNADYFQGDNRMTNADCDMLQNKLPGAAEAAEAGEAAGSGEAAEAAESEATGLGRRAAPAHDYMLRHGDVHDMLHGDVLLLASQRPNTAGLYTDDKVIISSHEQVQDDKDEQVIQRPVSTPPLMMMTYDSSAATATVEFDTSYGSGGGHSPPLPLPAAAACSDWKDVCMMTTEPAPLSESSEVLFELQHRPQQEVAGGLQVDIDLSTWKSSSQLDHDLSQLLLVGSHQQQLDQGLPHEELLSLDDKQVLLSFPSTAGDDGVHGPLHCTTHLSYGQQPSFQNAAPPLPAPSAIMLDLNMIGGEALSSGSHLISTKDSEPPAAVSFSQRRPHLGGGLGFSLAVVQQGPSSDTNLLLQRRLLIGATSPADDDADNFKASSLLASCDDDLMLSSTTSPTASNMLLAGGSISPLSQMIGLWSHQFENRGTGAAAAAAAATAAAAAAAAAGCLEDEHQQAITDVDDADGHLGHHLLGGAAVDLGDLGGAAVDLGDLGGAAVADLGDDLGGAVDLLVVDNPQLNMMSSSDEPIEAEAAGASSSHVTITTAAAQGSTGFTFGITRGSAVSLPGDHNNHHLITNYQPEQRASHYFQKRHLMLLDDDDECIAGARGSSSNPVRRMSADCTVSTGTPYNVQSRSDHVSTGSTSSEGRWNHRPLSSSSDIPMSYRERGSSRYRSSEQATTIGWDVNSHRHHHHHQHHQYHEGCRSLIPFSQPSSPARHHLYHHQHGGAAAAAAAATLRHCATTSDVHSLVVNSWSHDYDDHEPQQQTHLISHTYHSSQHHRQDPHNGALDHQRWWPHHNSSAASRFKASSSAVGRAVLHGSSIKAAAAAAAGGHEADYKQQDLLLPSPMSAVHQASGGSSSHHHKKDHVMEACCELPSRALTSNQRCADHHHYNVVGGISSSLPFTAAQQTEPAAALVVPFSTTLSSAEEEAAGTGEDIMDSPPPHASSCSSDLLTMSCLPSASGSIISYHHHHHHPHHPHLHGTQQEQQQQQQQQVADDIIMKKDHNVMLVYDEFMLKHREAPSPWGGREHPERPDRISAIWDRLREQGILDRCLKMKAREAQVYELLAVHERGLVEDVRLAAAHLEEDCNLLHYNTATAGTSSKDAAEVDAGDGMMREWDDEGLLLEESLLFDTSSILTSIMADMPAPMGGVAAAAAAASPAGHHDTAAVNDGRQLTDVVVDDDDDEPPNSNRSDDQRTSRLGMPSRRIRDCYLNSHTYQCARLAAGCAAELAVSLVLGKAHHGAAIIRPPGHHAESGTAMGFCYFNNAAVAARAAQAVGASRVLIMDWDIHHGNGTQHIFEDDPSVLYISTHRYDNGAFFPGTGAASEVGVGPGTGCTVNIPWWGPGVNDVDFIAAFNLVVMPIAKEFRPELVLVSAGFDAVQDDPLGECCVSPEAFGQLTKLMCQLGAPVALLLEGGYNLEMTAKSTEQCMRVLLGEELHIELNPKHYMKMGDRCSHFPHASIVESPPVSRQAQHAIRSALEAHVHHWKCVMSCIKSADDLFAERGSLQPEPGQSILSTVNTSEYGFRNIIKPYEADEVDHSGVRPNGDISSTSLNKDIDADMDCD